MSAPTQANSKNLAQYIELLEKIDAKFRELQDKYPAQIHCTRGCHLCCQPDLSVSELERQAIARFIKDNQLTAKLRQLKGDNPHGGSRCQFLAANGDCSIFLARPVICRSHGAPVLLESGEVSNCELNFTDSESSPQQGDWINLNTLNSILIQLNQLATKSGRRTKLDIDEILQE